MSETIETVRSLVVPLDNGSILLPGTVVAEIVPFVEPERTDAAAPDWVMGMAEWRDEQIPLISFEALCGEPVPQPSRTARIAVLKALGGAQELRYFGVLTQQIPRLLTVYEGGLEDLEREAGSPAVAARVMVNGEAVMIPDMDLLERDLKTLLA
ncbi:chemotaxis protein CheW [Alkalilimnicola sp. S0819]|uniref:chemotaxis protein CheW n=1 Tax=Alkalilimnicola sp. S0819 TaxID=2613922 RepID=UPI00126252CF|nr:chemotaxis protein CheW [Alkalilimnicola sp. S0819]KAB7628135.1 chemotaxis protein CheW [Alkalilimnicola sp. S0819]MPQ15020.1 chemotaxis protein CheW [Alkalilimnicola sp. S0819]